VQPAGGLRPGADQIVAVLGQGAQGRDGFSTTAVLRRVAVCAAMPADSASAWSVLRPCPVDMLADMVRIDSHQYIHNDRLIDVRAGPPSLQQLPDVRMCSGRKPTSVGS
jgi:hypothetical protein